MTAHANGRALPGQLESFGVPPFDSYPVESGVPIHPDCFTRICVAALVEDLPVWRWIPYLSGSGAPTDDSTPARHFPNDRDQRERTFLRVLRAPDGDAQHCRRAKLDAYLVTEGIDPGHWHSDDGAGAA